MRRSGSMRLTTRSWVRSWASGTTWRSPSAELWSAAAADRPTCIRPGAQRGRRLRREPALRSDPHGAKEEERTPGRTRIESIGRCADAGGGPAVPAIATLLRTRRAGGGPDASAGTEGFRSIGRRTSRRRRRPRIRHASRRRRDGRPRPGGRPRAARATRSRQDRPRPGGERRPPRPGSRRRRGRGLPRDRAQRPAPNRPVDRPAGGTRRATTRSPTPSSSSTSAASTRS